MCSVWNKCFKQHVHLKGKSDKENQFLKDREDKSMSAAFCVATGRRCDVWSFCVQAWAASWYLHVGLTSGWFLWTSPTMLMWFWPSIAPWKILLPLVLTPEKVCMSSSFFCFINITDVGIKSSAVCMCLHVWHLMQEKSTGLTVRWRKSAEPTSMGYHTKTSYLQVKDGLHV